MYMVHYMIAIVIYFFAFRLKLAVHASESELPFLANGQKMISGNVETFFMKLTSSETLLKHRILKGTKTYAIAEKFSSA